LRRCAPLSTIESARRYDLNLCGRLFEGPDFLVEQRASTGVGTGEEVTPMPTVVADEARGEVRGVLEEIVVDLPRRGPRGSSSESDQVDAGERTDPYPLTLNQL
jgi:hypothetical protein